MADKWRTVIRVVLALVIIGLTAGYLFQAGVALDPNPWGNGT